MPPTLATINGQLIWSAQNMTGDLAQHGLSLVNIMETHHLDVLSGLTPTGVHFETVYQHNRFLKLNMDYDDINLVSAFSCILGQQPVAKYSTRYTLLVTQQEREAIHYWWATDRQTLLHILLPIENLINYQEL